MGMLVNRKSLSWMGLTRERWCCTRGLVSRLDMNTCQTSIRPVYYYNIAEDPSSVLQTIENT